MSFLNAQCITLPPPQIPFCLRRKSITTGYLMRAHSQAQQIDYLALSTCPECPGTSAVKAVRLIYMFYKADDVLSSDTINH